MNRASSFAARMGIILCGIVLLPSCSWFAEPAQPMTREQRAIRAQQIRDLTSAAAALAGNRARPYLEAMAPILTAWVERRQAFDFATAFAAVRSFEPELRAALLDAGQDPERVEAMINGARVILGEIEFEVAGWGASPTPEPQPPPVES